MRNDDLDWLQDCFELVNRLFNLLTSIGLAWPLALRVLVLAWGGRDRGWTPLATQAFNPTGHRGLVNTGDGWKVQRMFFVNPIAVDTD